jgi:hypothetical protein
MARLNRHHYDTSHSKMLLKMKLEAKKDKARLPSTRGNLTGGESALGENASELGWAD